VRATTDRARLDTLFTQATTAPSLDDFIKALDTAG
jgi:hypothetical protein